MHHVSKISSNATEVENWNALYFPIDGEKHDRVRIDDVNPEGMQVNLFVFLRVRSIPCFLVSLESHMAPLRARGGI